MSAQRHSGRTAFITGAGSGIGRAIARRLAEEGCAVACTDLQSDAAEETAELLRLSGGDAMSFTVDVRDRGHIQLALDATVGRWGKLNYLVNNAGLVTMHSLSQLTDEQWDLVIDVNLKGQFLVTQLAAPLLAASTPSAIVCLSTIEAEVVVSSSGTCQPHYNASKGGVRMFAKAAAVELAKQGTRVNSVAPGPVQTGFIPGVDPTQADLPPFAKERLLIPRLGKPAEIAAGASFLLSDDASYITGTQLTIDGGWLAR